MSRHFRSPLRRMPRPPAGNKSSRSHTRAGDFGDLIELECLATRPEKLRWSANSFSPDEPRPSGQIDLNLPEPPGLVPHWARGMRHAASSVWWLTTAPIFRPPRSSATDLPAGHKAEEQDQRRVFARQRALHLYASAKFLVHPLAHVRRSQRASAAS